MLSQGAAADSRQKRTREGKRAAPCDLAQGNSGGKSAGITLADALSLPNFRKITPQESMAAARARNALLHCPQYELEEGAYKELARFSGALVFAFSDLLHESGFRRAIVLSKMRLALTLVRKSGCGFIVCTLASKPSELRTARELGAFQSVLGMNQHEREFSERTLGRLAGSGKKKDGGEK